MYYHPSQFGDTGNWQAAASGYDAGIQIARNRLAARELNERERHGAWQRGYDDNVFAQSRHVQNATLAWRQAEEERRAKQWAEQQAFRQQMTPVLSAKNLALIDETFGGASMMDPSMNPGSNPMMGGAPDPNALPAQGAPPVAPQLPSMPGNLAGASGGQMAGLGQMGQPGAGMQFGPTPSPMGAAVDQLYPRRAGDSTYHTAARSLAMNGDYDAQEAMFRLLGDEQSRAAIPHIAKALTSGRLDLGSIGNENVRAFFEALKMTGDTKTAMAYALDTFHSARQQDANARESEAIARETGMDPYDARAMSPRNAATIGGTRLRNAGRPVSAQEALMSADPNEIERATQMLQSDDPATQAQGRAWFAKTTGRLPAGSNRNGTRRGMDPEANPEKFQTELDRQAAVLRKRYPKLSEDEIRSMAYDRTQYGRPVNESTAASSGKEKGYGGDRITMPVVKGKAEISLPKGSGRSLAWDENDPIVKEFTDAAIDAGAISKPGFWSGVSPEEYDAKVENAAKAIAIRAGWKIGGAKPAEASPAPATKPDSKVEPKAGPKGTDQDRRMKVYEQAKKEAGSQGPEAIKKRFNELWSASATN